MFLLPYERLIIKTSLGVAEARKRIEDVVEPRKYLRGWFNYDHKPYHGEKVGDHFEINRVIHYRNSFLPNIRVDVLPAVMGSAVRVSMRPHPLTIIFMVFWLGVVGCISGAVAWPALHNGTLLSAPPDGLGLTVFMFVGGFKYESAQSKEFFRDLFQPGQVDDLGVLDMFRQE